VVLDKDEGPEDDFYSAGNSALTLWVGSQEEHPARKKLSDEVGHGYWSGV